MLMKAHDCPLPFQLQCCLGRSCIGEEFQRGGNIFYFIVFVLVLGESGPSLTDLLVEK